MGTTDYEYPWRNPEKMRELYVEEQLSEQDIADRFDTAGSVIHRWLKRHDIPSRKRGDTHSTKETPWRDESTLRRLHIDEGLSSYKIADRLDCSYQTVHDWLTRHDIETRDSPSQKKEADCPPRAELEEKYNTGLTTAELASEYGVYQQRVWQWLYDYGIERRPPAHGLSGEDSYGWVDNPIQREYDPLWRKQREKAIERDGECARCGMSRSEHRDEIGRDITVHHLRKARLFDSVDKAHELKNLITLCLPCHRAIERFPIDVRHIQEEHRGRDDG